MAPASIASRISFFIARDLVGRGGALGRFLAHDVEPQRRVAEQGGDVDRRAALLQRVEILREGLERPVIAQARLERVEAHALDLLERLHDQLAMDRPWSARRRSRNCRSPSWSRHARARCSACGPTGSGRRSGCARRRSPARRPCRWRRWSSSAGPSALPSATTLPSLMPRSPDEARLARAVDDRAARDLEVVGHWLAPERPSIIRRSAPQEETHGQA